MAQVLIIDDHDSMREGLELLLRRRGHKTVSADAGERGLALLEDVGADLVITDLKMAKMDGIQVLRRVRERHPEVEVLVITAYGTIEKAVEAMKLGAADFITKPFSSEEFGVKIDRLLPNELVFNIGNATLRVANENETGIIEAMAVKRARLSSPLKLSRQLLEVVVQGELPKGKAGQELGAGWG